MNLICLDGTWIAASQPALLADNRGFRYGDGLFETMKMVNGKIILKHFHFDRLFAGLQILQYPLQPSFTKEMLTEKIIDLCRKNECESLARIRLTVFRGNGGLYDLHKTTSYLIECHTLSDTVSELNTNGWVIDIFPEGQKSSDKFSNLKSANFLLYSMAAVYAQSHALNECLVLNTKGNIADGSITNIFLIKAGTVFTPSLDQGCVAGVMRRRLVNVLSQAGYDLREGAVSIDDLTGADEIFLTNAVQGIKWVRQFRDKIYTNTETKKIYNGLVHLSITDS